MLDQLGSAQGEMETAIADLMRSGAGSASIAEVRNQLASLDALRQQIASADGKTLVALRMTIAAAVSSGQSASQKALSDVASEATNQTMNAQQGRKAVEEVGRKLFDDKVLDPYLQFASAEDEAAYRRREEERRLAYEKELAKHTAEGDHRAAEIAKSQLADAKEHGADRAPEFAEMSAKVDAASAALGGATPTPAVSTDKEPVRSKDVASIAATLRAAGIQTPTTPDNDVAHGLSFDKLASISRSAERST